MLTYIGQFIGHDISQSLHGDAEQEDILVPKCDEFYDLECTGTQVLPFYRSSFNDTPTTPRQQVLIPVIDNLLYCAWKYNYKGRNLFQAYPDVVH